MLPLHQLQLQMAAPQQFLGGHLTPLAPEHGLGMADAEGFEPLLLAVKVAVDPGEGQQGFRFHRRAWAGLLQPGLGEPIELGLQRGHLLGPYGEAARRRMAAVPFQQIGAVPQGPVDGKPLWGPDGGPQSTLALAG